VPGQGFGETALEWKPESGDLRICSDLSHAPFNEFLLGIALLDAVPLEEFCALPVPLDPP
jgi:hypothetical protein